MEILKTEKLSKKFGAFVAMKNVSIDIHSGKIYGLLGPNGSGKSTFMKTIAGIYHPFEGSFKIVGEDYDHTGKRFIAYMPTESFFYKYMTIKQAKEFYMDFFEDFDEYKFKEILASMQLDEKMKIRALSSGMNAKLRVAITMSRKAKLYMLDEPLNGIDLITRDQIISTIIKEVDDSNAIILSSHLIGMVENILDDVLFIKNGVIVLQDNVEQTRQKYNKSIMDLYREVYAV